MAQKIMHSVGKGKASANFKDFGASKLRQLSEVKTAKFDGGVYDTEDGPRLIGNDNLDFLHNSDPKKGLLLNAQGKPAKEGEQAYVNEAILVQKEDNIVAFA